MNILGIDISTSNIGMVVADESDNIQEFISIPLSKLVKDKCLFKKFLFFEKIIEKILEKYTIDHVFIEKPLEFFKEGSSMSSTIILLNQFNMLCQYVLYQKKIKYHMVASSTALKCATGTGRKTSYVADKKIWLADFFEKRNHAGLRISCWHASTISSMVGRIYRCKVLFAGKGTFFAASRSIRHPGKWLARRAHISAPIPPRSISSSTISTRPVFRADSRIAGISIG